jgi:hypothetical protein
MAHGTLQILQLNVHKRREVQQSLLNDEGLKDYAVLAISEPYARTIDGSMVTVPMGHYNWTKSGDLSHCFLRLARYWRQSLQNACPMLQRPLACYLRTTLEPGKDVPPSRLSYCSKNKSTKHGEPGRCSA